MTTKHKEYLSETIDGNEIEKMQIPFGLIFVEKQEPQDISNLSYDYEDNMSYIDSNEGRVPFVEWEWATFSNTNSSTSTKSANEGSGGVRTPKTSTATKATEVTDSD